MGLRVGSSKINGVKVVGEKVNENVIITNEILPNGGIVKHFVSLQEAVPKDINFFDYDGTCLYSYTKTEWANVTALPANPSHSGLISQGWNYTKSDIDSELTAQPHAMINVGQNYITQSGDTEIDIELDELAKSPMLNLSPNGTVEIDWGDESAHDTITGSSTTSQVKTVHSYPSGGKYTIKIKLISGTYRTYSTSSECYPILCDNWQADADSIPYYFPSCVKRVRIGEGFASNSIGAYSFCGCGLESITIPNTMTGFGDHAFYKCSNLKFFVIPRGVANMWASLFAYCKKLKTVSIPNTVTNIAEYIFLHSEVEYVSLPSSVVSIAGNKQFHNDTNSRLRHVSFGNLVKITESICEKCTCISTIVIPESTTTINAKAFAGCKNIREYHIKPLTPPTLTNSNGIYTRGVTTIYVPEDSLETYKTASNWSTHASKMVGE